MFNGEFFNYEICVREPSPALSAPQRYYYIDDGPYFRNLSHLVEHYSKYEDGLPGLLLKPIRPNSVLLSSNSNMAAVPQLSQLTISHPNHNLLIPSMNGNDLIRGSMKSQNNSTNNKLSLQQPQQQQQPSTMMLANSSSSSSSSTSSVSNSSSSQALILNQFIKVGLTL